MDYRLLVGLVLLIGITALNFNLMARAEGQSGSDFPGQRRGAGTHAAEQPDLED